MSPPVPEQIILQAPVLVLPGVFERDFCAELIRRHEADGSFASGFFVGSEEVVDASVKRRRDHRIEPGTALFQAIAERLAARLLPEMRKAFHAAPANGERFAVVCYDGAEAGHFVRHRDDRGAATAHRQFAVTVNLNDGFAGGELVFPEYAPHLYCPAQGEAIAFSGSMLHEVRPVTMGRRYAFLAFLHDAASEARRRR